MQKWSLYIATCLAVCLLLTSCKKNDGALPPALQDSVIILPPSTFTKKILVENFLSTTCGHCARGISDLQHIDSLYHDQAVIVSFHGNGNDPMATPLWSIMGS